MDSPADGHGLSPNHFTSWGPAPTLDFKPEIAAIGSAVYSLNSEGGYDVMSGTSMASPNVAGQATLLLQSYPDLTRAQRAALAKTALLNTTHIPLQESGIPYAPRQIGAGYTQVEQAHATDVTVDDSPSAALREINGTRSFTVTLTNRGNTPATYTVDTPYILTETNQPHALTEVLAGSDTITADASTVSKPRPRSHSPSTPTSTPPTTPKGGSVSPGREPPFLGFAGDWEPRTSSCLSARSRWSQCFPHS